MLPKLVQAVALGLGRLLEGDCGSIDRGGTAASQCCIGESELASDLDPFRLVFGACGRARLGRPAAKIVRIASHAF